MNRIRSARRMASRVLVVVVTAVCMIPGSAPATPEVVVETGYTAMYTTQSDVVTNVPVSWTNSWGLSMNNHGPESFTQARIRLETPLRFTGFLPTDARPYLVAEPTIGRYTWDYGALEIAPRRSLGMGGLLAPVSAAPGFSASRTVDPLRLGAGTTTQTVTFDLRIDEPLPEGTTILDVSIGQPNMLFGSSSLVESTFVTQSPVADWEGTGRPMAAVWMARIEELEIGKWYRFQATLRVSRLHEIAGSPLCMPGVCISMRRLDTTWPPVSRVCEFAHPDGPTGSFEVSESVKWQLGYSRNHRILWLAQRMSKVVTTVSVRPSATSARRGATVRFTGRVAPSEGRTVQLQKRVRGVWRTVSPDQRVKDGGYSLTRIERVAGTYSYRVQVKPSSYAPAATSRKVQVRWR